MVGGGALCNTGSISGASGFVGGKRAPSVAASPSVRLEAAIGVDRTLESPSRPEGGAAPAEQQSETSPSKPSRVRSRGRLKKNIKKKQKTQKGVHLEPSRGQRAARSFVVGGVSSFPNGIGHNFAFDLFPLVGWRFGSKARLYAAECAVCIPEFASPLEERSAGDK